MCNTSTVPQSHSSPGSRKALPQTDPLYSLDELGVSSRQLGLALSRNTLSCSRLQSLNCSGNSELDRQGQSMSFSESEHYKLLLGRVDHTILLFVYLTATEGSHCVFRIVKFKGSKSFIPLHYYPCEVVHIISLNVHL